MSSPLGRQLPEPTWSIADLGVLVQGDEPTRLKYFDTHPSHTSASAAKREGGGGGEGVGVGVGEREREGEGKGGGVERTIIAIHGTGFNARIWIPILPFLPPQTRVLAFNRRGYEGSSPAHQPKDGEKKPGPGNVEAFGRYVLDLAAFVKYAVDELGIGKGEIVLLGWSKGCASIIGLLSHLPTSPPLSPSSSTHSPPHPVPLPAPLDPYTHSLTQIRCVTLFEPPQMLVGLPGPAEYPELRHIPPEQLPLAFGELLMSTVPPERREQVLGAEDKEGAREDLGTWNGASADERRGCCERAFGGGGRGWRVGVMWCEGTTIPAAVNGAKWIAEYCASHPPARDADSEARSKRFAVKVLEGGNHFVMATDPGNFVGGLVELGRELGVGW